MKTILARIPLVRRDLVNPLFEFFDRPGFLCVPFVFAGRLPAPLGRWTARARCDRGRRLLLKAKTLVGEVSLVLEFCFLFWGHVGTVSRGRPIGNEKANTLRLQRVGSSKGAGMKHRPAL